MTAKEALDRAIAAVEAAQDILADVAYPSGGDYALLAQAWAAIADQLKWAETDDYVNEYEGEGGDGGDSQLLCQACEEGHSQVSVIQDDLAELLRILGLGDHARPKSPHHVFVDEVLPAIRKLVRDGGDHSYWDNETGIRVYDKEREGGDR